MRKKGLPMHATEFTGAQVPGHCLQLGTSGKAEKRGGRTVEHALHEGRGAQVAALDDVDEHQEVGRQAKQQGGDEGAGHRKQQQCACGLVVPPSASPHSRVAY